jgi:hypothetical protein
VANFQLRNSHSQSNSSERDIVVALARGASVTRLSGTSFAPQASASLIQPRSGNGYLVVAGLPSTRAQRVYELWFVRRSVPTPAGTFTYTGSSVQVVRVPLSSRGYALTAVTDEAHAVPAPTGHAVLSGKLGA